MVSYIELEKEANILKNKAIEASNKCDLDGVLNNLTGLIENLMAITSLPGTHNYRSEALSIANNTRKQIAEVFSNKCQIRRV